MVYFLVSQSWKSKNSKKCYHLRYISQIKLIYLSNYGIGFCHQSLNRSFRRWFNWKHLCFWTFVKKLMLRKIWKELLETSHLAFQTHLFFASSPISVRFSGEKSQTYSSIFSRKKTFERKVFNSVVWVFFRFPDFAQDGQRFRQHNRWRRVHYIFRTESDLKNHLLWSLIQNPDSPKNPRCANNIDSYR